MKKTEGHKADDGKPRYDLLPAKALHETVEVLTYGAQKYGEENWRVVDNSKRRYFAAALRHMFAWWRDSMGRLVGSDDGSRDRESQRHHLAHAICCLMFILDDEV